MTLLEGEEKAESLFTWLKGRPFVQERTEGWNYHDVAREQMLRYKQREAPQGWAKLQQQLAEYYEKLRDDLGLEEEKGWKDETWQSYALEALYHRLCQAPHKYLAFALNGYLTALGEGKGSFELAWAKTVQEAGQNTGASAKEVKKWGERLVEDVAAWREKRLEGVAANVFTTLLENPAIEAKGRAVALKERGVAYRLMGKYEEALADLTRVLELDPDDVLATAERGGAYRMMGKYEEALADLNHALELDPNPKGVWAIVSRGLTYRQMRKYEEALADLTRAIELDPNDPNYTWAITLRGETYQMMGKYEEALADFTRAIELKPDYAWAITLRGEAYQLMGRFEEAMAEFNSALELEPEEGWWYYIRAITFQSLVQTEKVAEDLAKAIDLGQKRYEKNSTNWLNWFDLAIYHLAAGDLAATTKLYHEGLTGGASQWNLRMAIRDLDQFLGIFPNHAEALALKAELEGALK
jgi:tetratricopeptide (TPR) repeat protein